MIIKLFELDKIDLKDKNFFLLHGKNEGLKNEIISKLASKNENIEILKLDEKQILENHGLFYDEILSNSLFNIKNLS